MTDRAPAAARVRLTRAARRIRALYGRVGTRAGCPGYIPDDGENPCRCPCPGCRHHCAACHYHPETRR